MWPYGIRCTGRRAAAGPGRVRPGPPEPHRSCASNQTCRARSRLADSRPPHSAARCARRPGSHALPVPLSDTRLGEPARFRYQIHNRPGAERAILARQQCGQIRQGRPPCQRLRVRLRCIPAPCSRVPLALAASLGPSARDIQPHPAITLRSAEPSKIRAASTPALGRHPPSCSAADRGWPVPVPGSGPSPPGVKLTVTPTGTPACAQYADSRHIRHRSSPPASRLTGCVIGGLSSAPRPSISGAGWSSGLAGCRIASHQAWPSRPGGAMSPARDPGPAPRVRARPVFPEPPVPYGQRPTHCGGCGQQAYWARQPVGLGLYVPSPARRACAGARPSRPPSAQPAPGTFPHLLRRACSASRPRRPDWLGSSALPRGLSRPRPRPPCLLICGQSGTRRVLGFGGPAARGAARRGLNRPRLSTRGQSSCARSAWLGLSSADRSGAYRPPRRRTAPTGCNGDQPLVLRGADRSR